MKNTSTTPKIVKQYTLDAYTNKNISLALARTRAWRKYHSENGRIVYASNKNTAVVI